MLDAVTFGETMVMMNPEESGSLKYVSRFSRHLGGTESNFAIGLARLGLKAGWISRLGRDSFGDYVESFIRGEGVDVSRVKRDDSRPTGLMVKERFELGRTRIHYYRRGSAASRMVPGDLDPEYIAAARHLHLTGITPALSDSCRKTVYRAIELARGGDLTISFDPNLRLKLWSGEEMIRVILDIAARADVVLPGFDEGRILFDTDDPDEMISRFLALGPDVVVLKLGAAGAVLGTAAGTVRIPGVQVERVVDPVGAGDGFAAGFVAGQLRGHTLRESVRLANAVGAFATTVRGDVEGLPTWEELQLFLGERAEVER
ncbi:MAG: sugar kinase [Bacillota bacterium]